MASSSSSRRPFSKERLPKVAEEHSAQFSKEDDTIQEHREDHLGMNQRLHLYQHPQIAGAIDRYWKCLAQLDVSATTGDPIMRKEGYVQLNLCFQKALVPDFKLEDALVSAEADWSEDARGDILSRDEFCMFLFELTSIWCSPEHDADRPPDLFCYLFFLSTVFVHISYVPKEVERKKQANPGESRLKNLDDVKLLPKKFFDILTAPPRWKEDRLFSPPNLNAQNEEQLKRESTEKKAQEKKFLRWFIATERNEPDIVVNVVKRVFELTHDMRAQLLCLLGTDDQARETKSVWRQTFESFSNGNLLPIHTLSPAHVQPALPKKLGGLSEHDQKMQHIDQLKKARELAEIAHTSPRGPSHQYLPSSHHFPEEYDSGSSRPNSRDRIMKGLALNTHQKKWFEDMPEVVTGQVYRRRSLSTELVDGPRVIGRPASKQRYSPPRSPHQHQQTYHMAPDDPYPMGENPMITSMQSIANTTHGPQPPLQVPYMKGGKLITKAPDQEKEAVKWKNMLMTPKGPAVHEEEPPELQELSEMVNAVRESSDSRAKKQDAEDPLDPIQGVITNNPLLKHIPTKYKARYNIPKNPIELPIEKSKRILHRSAIDHRYKAHLKLNELDKDVDLQLRSKPFNKRFERFPARAKMKLLMSTTGDPTLTDTPEAPWAGPFNKRPETEAAWGVMNNRIQRILKKAETRKKRRKRRRNKLVKARQQSALFGGNARKGDGWKFGLRQDAVYMHDYITLKRLEVLAAVQNAAEQKDDADALNRLIKSARDRQYMSVGTGQSEHAAGVVGRLPDTPPLWTYGDGLQKGSGSEFIDAVLRDYGTSRDHWNEGMKGMLGSYPTHVRVPYHQRPDKTPPEKKPQVKKVQYLDEGEIGSVTALMEKAGVDAEYHLSMANFLKTQGCQIVDKNGQERTIEDGTLVLLYFSAHWCPPCRGFTPLLKQFYEKAKAAGEKFEVVFMSSDRSAADQASYMRESHGDWCTLPHGSPQIQGLGQRYGVRGIPGVVILMENGQRASLGDQERQMVQMGAQGDVTAILEKMREAAGLAAKIELPDEVEVDVNFRNFKHTVQVFPAEGLAMFQLQVFSLTEVPETQQRVYASGIGAVTDDRTYQKALSQTANFVVLSNASVWDKTDAFPAEKTMEFKQQQMALLQYKIQRVAEKTMKRNPGLAENLKQEIAQRIQRSVSHWNQVNMYEDPSTIIHAFSKIPLDTLHTNAVANLAKADGKDKTYADALLREVLRWFKKDFFRWADGPPDCPEPKQDLQMMGGAEPTPAERAGLANNVEVYKSKKTGKTYRYPRYNHPKVLLDTRWGRCGEWANCFACVCRALGYETRWVHDVTDHVWVEVWSDERQRWMHLDPCENAFDNPKLYEKGWGKRLSYITGYARDHTKDTSPRYIMDWANIFDPNAARKTAPNHTHRNQDLEDSLQFSITLLSEVFLDEFVGMMEGKEQLARRKVVENRNKLDDIELAKHKNGENPTGDTAEANVGRITGDAAWREQRGEAGANLEAKKNAESAIATGSKPEESAASSKGEMVCEGDVCYIKPKEPEMTAEQKAAKAKADFVAAVKKEHERLVGEGLDKKDAATQAIQNVKNGTAGGAQ